MRLRQATLILASILVSAFFLYLVLRDVPLEELLDSLRRVDLSWVLLALLLTLAGLWARAVRWRGLLAFRVTPADSFAILGVTFLLNQLPLRIGEVARSLLATRRAVPLITAATSVVVERVLDLLIVVLFLAFGIALLPDSAPEVARSAVAAGILGFLAFAGLLLLARYPTLAQRGLRRVERVPVLNRLPLRQWLDHGVDGLQPLTRWRSLWHALLWTAISWSFSLLVMLVLCAAFVIAPERWLALTLLGIALASLSIAIPVSVASFGPFEAAIVFAGALLGLDAALSLTLGLLLHAISLIVYASLGFYGFTVLGVSLSDMLRSAEQR